MRHDAGADPVSAGPVVPPCRDVADVVLAVRGARSRGQRLAGVGGGLAASVAAWLALVVLRPPPRPSSPLRPRPIPTFEISLDDAPEPMRPPRAAPAVPSRSPPPAAPRAPIRSGARTRPVEPAHAARVLTREPHADEPVDLTAADVFVAGTARQYAGGATSSAGTSTSPGPGRGAPGEPASGAFGTRSGGRSDLSRPVSLAGESWSCPWPTEAEPLAIDEQAVLIRVVVRSDGTVEEVTVVSDPGDGFGDAAAECARRARFLPARGPNGQTVRATSPPIRVRFSR